MKRLLLALLLLLPLPAAALDTITYTPGELAARQAAGTPFLLDFFATWCVTCKVQHEVLDELLAANPAYKSIPIVLVDWDTYERSDLVRDMAIPRRSTLVMMQGTTELGRIVAGTSPDDIRALLDTGL